MNRLILAFLIFSSVGLMSETHKGRIIFKNGDVIKSKTILIQDSVVKYKLSTEPSTIIIDKKNINKIEIVDGNYGLYGLGAGLIFSLPFANNARNDNVMYMTFAAGGCIGLLLGTLINDYHTIRFDDNDNLSLFDGVKLMPEINQPNVTLLSYIYNF